MTPTKILITGATGYTGRYTTEILTEQGFSVRTLVHRHDERSEKLRSTGAEIMVGDMLNLSQVREALEGVNAAYFVYPIRPGLIEASAYFAQAAKEAGVAAVVNMSQISARRDSKSDAARDHMKLPKFGQQADQAFARRRSMHLITGSSREIGAAIASLRFGYRRWLLAIALAVTVVLAAGCSSKGNAVNVRLITPVLTNPQAPSSEEDGWHQRFGGDGWYRPTQSPSFKIVH